MVVSNRWKRQAAPAATASSFATFISRSRASNNDYATAPPVLGTQNSDGHGAGNNGCNDDDSVADPIIPSSAASVVSMEDSIDEYTLFESRSVVSEQAQRRPQPDEQQVHHEEHPLSAQQDKQEKGVQELLFSAAAVVAAAASAAVAASRRSFLDNDRTDFSVGTDYDVSVRSFPKGLGAPFEKDAGTALPTPPIVSVPLGSVASIDEQTIFDSQSFVPRDDASKSSAAVWLADDSEGGTTDISAAAKLNNYDPERTASSIIRPRTTASVFKNRRLLFFLAALLAVFIIALSVVAIASNRISANSTTSLASAPGGDGTTGSNGTLPPIGRSAVEPPASSERPSLLPTTAPKKKGLPKSSQPPSMIPSGAPSLTQISLEPSTQTTTPPQFPGPAPPQQLTLAPSTVPSSTEPLITLTPTTIPPTPQRTLSPTSARPVNPTSAPTNVKTSPSTAAPTRMPKPPTTLEPSTRVPVVSAPPPPPPTRRPTTRPTRRPTAAPIIRTPRPTVAKPAPTQRPTRQPTKAPTVAKTNRPSLRPTDPQPTPRPTFFERPTEFVTRPTRPWTLPPAGQTRIGSTSRPTASGLPIR